MTDSRCEDTCKSYAELGVTACEGCVGNRIPLEKEDTIDEEGGENR